MLTRINSSAGGALTGRALSEDQTSRLNISEDRRSYTDQEFAVILSKASELAGTSDTADFHQGGHSLAEMKAIAAELGLDPVLIERAARLMPMGSSVSRWLGLASPA